MKKFLKYGLFVLMLGISQVGFAQVTNRLGFSLEAGEWTLMPFSSKAGLKNSLGYNGGIDFVYELQYRHFLFDLGVGATAGQTFFSVDNMEVRLEKTFDMDPFGETPLGDQFDYVYNINKRKDQYTNVAVQIPLLVGATVKRFYFLAGAKIQVNAYTTYSGKGLLTTHGEYEKTGDLWDMPEHQFYRDLPLSKDKSTSFNIDVLGHLEIGGRLGFMTDKRGFDVPKVKHQYRLAAFADFGILDFHKSGNSAVLTTPIAYNPHDMVSDLQMADVLSVQDAAKSVHNLVVGIKFTMLFDLPEKGVCVICHDPGLPKRYKSFKHQTRKADD